MITFRVLGPLVAEDARGRVDLKGPRHRAVLARLLIARGRVVPVEQLVVDLWEDPPPGAVGAVQTFVAALRKSLEPERPPRTPARLLVTSGPGYALRAEAVDAWQFEEALSRERFDEAVELWRGPAYAEFADEPWARGEIARLDELRLLALERRTGVLLSTGRAAEAVPDLEALVDGHPWREEAWRLLALARYRTGRQGEALETVRRARTLLAEELGVDPGPDLRQLEADILVRSPALAGPPPRSAPLVGRVSELTQLSAAAEAARDRLTLVLIAGEAGAGKTALAEAFTASVGWTTAWGANPDDEGVPAAWPWLTILDGLAGPAPTIDPAVARFHWHRAVTRYLAGHAPLLLVLDDLHWAGEETLALLASLVLESPAGILVIATYRTTDVPARLTAFLGRVARAEPTRLYLGGLPREAVRDLVRTMTGDDAGADVIYRRSGGNPFFARELARLLATGGDLSSVPAGVRDVVRYRVATLPEVVQLVLRHAAVLGQEIDLDLLPGDDVLDALEKATERGFLVEHGPGRFRFAHALVKDTLYQDLSRSRLVRWHAEVADRLEQIRPYDVEALAHHLLRAEAPVRAAPYAFAAAEQAERRFAPHQAARLWRTALDHTTDPRKRLASIMGLVRALAVTGGLATARQYRAEALTLADPDPALTATVIAAFDVPAIWTTHDDPVFARRIVEVTERTLAVVTEPAVRSRLLSTIALELRNTGDARAAALEAETIAREVGDPAVLAFALNARFMQSFDRAGLAPQRAAIGRELVELAATHRMVTFEVLGHLILVQSHSALADFIAADQHAAEADRLGTDYEIPLVGILTDWYRAMRASVSGRPAEAAYRAAATRLAGAGMPGMSDGLLGLALLCDAVQRGVPPRPTECGGYEPWCRPGTAPIPRSPRDLLFEARTCLHALTAIRRDDRETMARLYADLAPAANELAGAGSGVLTLRPVAYYLGELATALGHDAEDHHRQAAEIAKRAGAPHWA